MIQYDTYNLRSAKVNMFIDLQLNENTSNEYTQPPPLEDQDQHSRNVEQEETKGTVSILSE